MVRDGAHAPPHHEETTDAIELICHRVGFAPASLLTSPSTTLQRFGATNSVQVRAIDAVSVS